MVVLSTLTVLSLLGSSHLQRAGRGMGESPRSLYAAEAGVNAVLAEWDFLSYDTLLTTPGDSVDLGWRTLENGATYEAVFVRVDGGSTGRAIHSLRVVGHGAGSFADSTTIFREIHPTFSGIDAAVKGEIAGEELELDFEGFGGSSLGGLDTIPSQWAIANVCDPQEDRPGVVWQDTERVDVSAASNLDGAPPVAEDTLMTVAHLLLFGGCTYDDLAAIADITIIHGP